MFSKYDKHRKLILDDILASIARLPTSKRSLRSYRLSRNENIQMLTALVLQLIQCVVELPSKLAKNDQDKQEKEQVDQEMSPEAEVKKSSWPPTPHFFPSIVNSLSPFSSLLPIHHTYFLEDGPRRPGD